MIYRYQFHTCKGIAPRCGKERNEQEGSMKADIATLL